MNYLQFYQKDIVFQEVPDEISLCYSITGCGGQCLGCHSEHLWKESESDFKLTPELLKSDIEKYAGYISCVCFLGGDWKVEMLLDLLKICKEYGLKTCVYTSRSYLNRYLLNFIDYAKYGKFNETFGGLNSMNTNQKFIKVATGECLNYKFQRNSK